MAKIALTPKWWIDNRPKGVKANDTSQNRATANAAKTVKGLEGFFSPRFAGRIDGQVLEHRSGHTFGLSGSDANDLGTHEVAVIFVP
jgi:hypothetical protein